MIKSGRAGGSLTGPARSDKQDMRQRVSSIAVGVYITIRPWGNADQIKNREQLSTNHSKTFIKTFQDHDHIWTCKSVYSALRRALSPPSGQVLYRRYISASPYDSSALALTLLCLISRALSCDALNTDMIEIAWIQLHFNLLSTHH